MLRRNLGRKLTPGSFAYLAITSSAMFLILLRSSRIRCLTTALALLVLGCSPDRAGTFDREVAAGDTVVLSSASGQVGLWLMYESRCEPDITYNWVDSGTSASLTGDVCNIGAGYLKIQLSGADRERFQITGHNLWVEAGDVEFR